MNRALAYLEKIHIFFAPCWFKAKATDELICLGHSLMSSGCLEQNEKDPEIEAGVSRRKHIGDVCAPYSSHSVNTCVFTVSYLDATNKAGYLLLMLNFIM